MLLSSTRLLEMESSVCFLFTLLFATALLFIFELWSSFWWKPRRIKSIFRAQGIHGPPSRFFHGNLSEFVRMNEQARSIPMPQVSHNILARVYPQHSIWSKEYGDMFVYWLGYIPRLLISNPELVKEIVYNRSGHFPKPQGRPDAKDLLGGGLASLEGEKWAQHRRIVNPAFFMEKLKTMSPTIATCSMTMLETWQCQLEQGGGKEIDVHKEFRTVTADVISHTAFGSSFAEGKQVFELQREQQMLLEKILAFPYIPGLRFLPTSINRHRWSVNSGIQKSLMCIIKKRIESTKGGRTDLYGNDLLGLMMAAYRKELEGNQKKLTMDMQEIVDECKTFFFAGHETTSTLLTWTLMLLSSSSEWQERARAEVFAVCGASDPPDGDSLPRLKIIGMVLNESLRLYPPATAIIRQTVKDMRLANDALVIPQGVSVMVPILAMHHDPELWGEDVNEFKPERFEEGVMKACKHPMAFLPFSVGPRNCVGQNFAMMEAKVVLSMILQRFSFRLSERYQHAPTLHLTLQPQHGMPIIFHIL